MRVALLTNFVAPYRVPLLRALAARAGELRIIASTPMEADRDWQPSLDGLDVVYQRCLTLPKRHRYEGFTDRGWLHLPLDTQRQLESFRPDVVISGELGLRSIQSALYARRAGVPLVLWCTLTDYLESARGRARRSVRHWLLPRADAVLVHGQAAIRYLRQYRVRDERFLRVPQPTDVDRFAQARETRPALPRRVLVVGRLIELKGVRPFLGALNAWCAAHPDREIELIVVGGGAERSAIEAVERVHNLTLRMLGEVRYEALPEIYRNADLLAFPTFGDEWGLVVNEAMSSGLPVLGSVRAQAVEEWVEEGRTGWRFDPLADGSMLAAIDRALTTPPSVIEPMGRNAAELARAWPADRVAATIVARMEELAGAGATAGAKPT